MPRKLPYPKFLDKTPCAVTLEDNITPSVPGAPAVAATWTGKCWYSPGARASMTGGRQEVIITGVVQMGCDIAPQLPTIASGTVTVGGAVYRIHAAARPHNPDGSVHHTTLELI